MSILTNASKIPVEKIQLVLIYMADTNAIALLDTNMITAKKLALILMSVNWGGFVALAERA